ncbi:MAG: DUF2617 family protein, partial [Planctomycetes bacterium]|nr:DUF2617 family protein [Planctomycetota bacterium]
ETSPESRGTDLMKVDFARPDVSDLVLHVYGRSVHPELFDVYAATPVWYDAYEAVLRICDGGHTVSFRTADQAVTEVAAGRGNPLPQHKRLLEQRLRGCRDEALRFPNGLVYQVSFQLERLEPEVFLKLHEELLGDCARANLAHRFPPQTRLAPGPLSLIRTDAAPRSLLVHAFHTFPESCAVVRTQSLFEL